MSLSPPDYERLRRYGPLPQLNAQGVLVQTYQHIEWQGLGKGYTIQFIEYPVGSFPAFTTMADPMEDEEELPFTKPPSLRRGPLLKKHRQKAQWEVEQEYYDGVWERHTEAYREKMRKLREEDSKPGSTTTTKSQSDAEKTTTELQSDAEKVDDKVSDAQATETAAKVTVEATNDLKAFILLALPFFQDIIWPPLISFILAYLSFRLLYTHRRMVLDHKRRFHLPSMADIYTFLCALYPIAVCLFISFFAISGVILGSMALILRALVEHYTGFTLKNLWKLDNLIYNWINRGVDRARPLADRVSETLPEAFGYLRRLMTQSLLFPHEIVTFILEPTSSFSSFNVPILTSTVRNLVSAWDTVYRILINATRLFSSFVSAISSMIRGAANEISIVCPLMFRRVTSIVTGLYYDFTYTIRAILRYLTRPQFWAGCVLALLILRICIDRKLAGSIICSSILLLFTYNWTFHTTVYPDEPLPAPPTTEFYFETPGPRQLAARSSPRKVFT